MEGVGETEVERGAVEHRRLLAERYVFDLAICRGAILVVVDEVARGPAFQVEEAQARCSEIDVLRFEGAVRVAIDPWPLLAIAVRRTERVLDLAAERARELEDALRVVEVVGHPLR